MAVRRAATTLATSCLVLLIQASDCAPRACPPTDEVAKPGPASRSTGDTDLGRRPGSDSPVPPRRIEAPAPRTETAPLRDQAPATRTETPPPQAETPRPHENVAPAASTPSPAPTPEKPPALDLSSLEKRLRDTTAIGAFTKLSLKNQVDDLLEQFTAFHAGRSEVKLATLREGFDLLLLKVLSLLQDKDPALARDISASRESLWNLLADPAKFANL